MKYLLFVLSLVLSVSVSASSGDYQEMLIAKARAAGMGHRFSARCGADQNLLNQYQAKYKTRTRAESLQRYPDFNIDAEYELGVAEAERFYDGIKNAANRALVCQQMEQRIRQELASPY